MSKQQKPKVAPVRKNEITFDSSEAEVVFVDTIKINDHIDHIKIHFGQSKDENSSSKNVLKTKFIAVLTVDHFDRLKKAVDSVHQKMMAEFKKYESDIKKQIESKKQ